MRKAFLLSLLLSGFYFSQIKSTSFSDLEIRHQSAPKPIIIHIYTSWCSVCKIEAFELKKDKNLVSFLNDNFYYIPFDAEKTKEKIRFQGKEYFFVSNGTAGIHELVLALSKNKKQQVYPLWIVLDQNFNLLEYHEGRFKPEDLKVKLQGILNER